LNQVAASENDTYSPPELIFLLLGAMTWGGLYARNPGIRAILPLIR